MYFAERIKRIYPQKYFFVEICLDIVVQLRPIMMKIRELVSVLNADIITGMQYVDLEIIRGFASDLMSDVLTLDTDKMVLITGLSNMQTIRTAEMAEIQCVLFVRNKKVTEEMLSLANENKMVILQSKYSMFQAVGKLYRAGLEPVY